MSLNATQVIEALNNHAKYLQFLVDRTALNFLLILGLYFILVSFAVFKIVKYLRKYKIEFRRKE